MTDEVPTDSPSPTTAPPPKKKLIGLLLSVAIFIGAAVLAGYLLSQKEHFPQTSDAYVQARYISVAPEVPGRITDLPVKDGSVVEPGDLLVQVDPQTYELDVAEAEAQIAVLEAEIAEAERQKKSSEELVEVAKANTERVLAQEALAKETYDRMTPLAEKGFVTKEKYAATTSEYEQAQASVLMARGNEIASELSVPSLESLRAELKAARITLQQAQVELERSSVIAPFRGRIVNCDIAPGMMVMPGESLFTLVDTREWFVIANYREGDLDGIEIGSKAKIRLLTLPKQEFTGEVVSVGVAVQTQDGYNFGPLPSVKNDLNWVRVAQRFPVRIRIDQAEPENAFRMGASAVVTIEKP